MVPQLYCRQAKGVDDPFADCNRSIKFVNEVEVVARFGTRRFRGYGYLYSLSFQSSRCFHRITLHEVVTSLRVIWSSLTDN